MKRTDIIFKIPAGTYYTIKESDVDLDFGDNFGTVCKCDVGKRVYKKSYGLVMENNEQLAKRRGGA